MHGHQVSVYEIHGDSGRELMETADLVVGVDIISNRHVLVYGRDAVQQIVDEHKLPRSVLYVTYDQDANELEYLCAVCQIIKGRHDCCGGGDRE